MKRINGFTLLELLVVVTISMSLFLGIYGLKQLWDRNQLAVIERELISALHYARIISLTHSEPLTLAPLDGNNWSTGMVLYAGNKNNILHQWQWHAPNIQISWQGFRNNDRLIFAQSLEQAAQNGTFHVSLDHQEKVKIIVNRLGHVRLAQSLRTV